MKLQKNWDKYHKYWEQKQKSSSSLMTFLTFMAWILHRAYLGVRFPKLEFLIDAYTGQSSMLDPVKIEKIGERMARIQFTRKGCSE
jgi:hypothetical protein